MNARCLPPLPYPEFPLRFHRNGQWYKSVWNPRTKKPQQYYFGSWKDDPKGDRALNDPATGWLARRSAIKAGCDTTCVQAVGADLALGELMGRFLAYKLSKCRAGELSATTLGDYLIEIRRFVEFMGPATQPGLLRPEHFTAYMNHLLNRRKLGRHSRRRVRAYVNCFLRHGVTNGWHAMPAVGVDWTAPAVDPESIRQAKARAGVTDYSRRILSGDEIDTLLRRASPTFKAMILLGINAGLGPADVARLRWKMIDMKSGRLQFPRFKTGTMRVGYLWKRTRRALRVVSELKQNRLALSRDSEASLVFVTKTGLPFYRETEVYVEIGIGVQKIRKLAGIKVDKPILSTFGRMVRELRLNGVSFYRLRHTFKTLGKYARDRETLDLMMGHKDTSTGKIYDHEEISWRRVRRVARTVHRKLWPKVKRQEGTPSRPRRRERGDAAEGLAA